MTEAPLPAHDCPVCGQPNQCAPAREGRFDVDCWCAALRIDPALLGRLPASCRGRACLCPACVVAGADAAREPSA